MNAELYQVILAPHVSEKSTRVAEKNSQIVFRVRRDASKPVIKQAVEKMFNVQVESVTVTNVKGKVKKFGKTPGRRQDWKRRMCASSPVRTLISPASKPSKPDGKDLIQPWQSSKVKPTSNGRRSLVKVVNAGTAQGRAVRAAA